MNQKGDILVTLGPFEDEIPLNSMQILLNISHFDEDQHIFYSLNMF